MICWSCQKELSDTAMFCPHCEAEVEAAPTPEERATVEDFLVQMDPDVLGELRNAFEQSATGEDFVNRIMIGNCPQCGSSQTGDCESDPDIDDPCVARCFDCSQLWCPDCGEVFEKAALAIKHDCPVWEDFDDDEMDE